MRLIETKLVFVVMLIALVNTTSKLVSAQNNINSENIAASYLLYENCVPWTKDDIGNQLYNSVIAQDYESAVMKCLKLENEGRGPIIFTVVKRLINEGNKNTVDFAYSLWNIIAKNIVKDYFPLQFQLLFSRSLVSIHNKTDGFSLNLDNVTDEGDRLAFGDGYFKNSIQISWRILPIWENNSVYFKIKNNYRHQNLKLEVNANGNGDHKAWSSDNDDTYRHQWNLQPVMCGKEVCFYIYNREYKQPLKLSSDMDPRGNRVLWSHNGKVTDIPEHFGWAIKPY